MSFIVGGLRLEQPFRVRRIGHFGYHSPDLNGTRQFLTRDLGLIISDIDDFTDRVPQLSKEDATGLFLRCGSDHHTLVVGSQKLVDTREPARKGAVVGQVSWQVGSLQEVVDGVRFLGERAKLRRIGRDAPGSNWHAYAYDPDGYINEIFYGMEQIGWDGYSKPVAMYDRAFTDCPPLPQMSEYDEVETALTRGDSLSGYRSEQPEASFDVGGVLMPQPFKLTHLGRIGLFVADMEASLAFYENILGLKVNERIRIDGQDCAYLRAANEHHSLALYPAALRETAGYSAMCGFAVASYQQLVDAHHFLSEKQLVVSDMKPEYAPGIHYGFYVQGPDQVRVHIYYGMDSVERDAQVKRPTTLPAAVERWPDSIAHGDTAWHDPIMLGPLA